MNVIVAAALQILNYVATLLPAGSVEATALAWVIKILSFIVTPTPAPAKADATPIHPEAAAMLAALPKDKSPESLAAFFKAAK